MKTTFFNKLRPTGTDLPPGLYIDFLPGKRYYLLDLHGFTSRGKSF